ncbi:hypothetical protein [Aggregatilinea lenta]|uniref:hypothetical protein n=1 Tax=Aggregatilinea lenta TaxID=913108 RepID=UPI000E5AF43B|nr:hypothetical protein [Aggregatilinea lenta]
MSELEQTLDALDFDWTLRCQDGQYAMHDDFGVETRWHLTPDSAVRDLVFRREVRRDWLRRFPRRKFTGASDATLRRARRRV